jgi:hypothetical protein
MIFLYKTKAYRPHQLIDLFWSIVYDIILLYKHASICICFYHICHWNKATSTNNLDIKIKKGQSQQPSTTIWIKNQNYLSIKISQNDPKLPSDSSDCKSPRSPFSSLEGILGNHPQFHHFYRWYGYHSQRGKNDIVLPPLSQLYKRQPTEWRQHFEKQYIISTISLHSCLHDTKNILAPIAAGQVGPSPWSAQGHKWIDPLWFHCRPCPVEALRSLSSCDFPMSFLYPWMVCRSTNGDFPLSSSLI